MGLWLSKIFGLFGFLVLGVYLSMKKIKKYEQDQKDFRIIIPMRIDSEILILKELMDSVRYKYNCDDLKEKIQTQIDKLYEERTRIV